MVAVVAMPVMTPFIVLANQWEVVNSVVILINGTAEKCLEPRGLV